MASRHPDHQRPTYHRLLGPVEPWQRFDAFNAVSATTTSTPRKAPPPRHEQPLPLPQKLLPEAANTSPPQDHELTNKTFLTQVEWNIVAPHVGVWIKVLGEKASAPSDLPPWPFFVVGPLSLIREISNLGSNALDGKISSSLPFLY